jgi:peroxin-14
MDRERVNKVVNDVEEAVVSVREAEESWRGEMREIRGEVESVRELVPRVSLSSSMMMPLHIRFLHRKLSSYRHDHVYRKEADKQMIEKHSATQSSALSDLQSELKSLKTLLLSRQNIPSSSSSNTSPPSGATNGESNTNTNNAANALLGKARSIPAWQMGPSKSESEVEGKGKEKESGA